MREKFSTEVLKESQPFKLSMQRPCLSSKILHWYKTSVFKHYTSISELPQSAFLKFVGFMVSCQLIWISANINFTSELMVWGHVFLCLFCDLKMFSQGSTKQWKILVIRTRRVLQYPSSFHDPEGFISCCLWSQQRTSRGGCYEAVAF